MKKLFSETMVSSVLLREQRESEVLLHDVSGSWSSLGIDGDFQRQSFSLHFPLIYFSYKVLEEKRKRVRVSALWELRVSDISHRLVLGSGGYRGLRRLAQPSLAMLEPVPRCSLGIPERGGGGRGDYIPILLQWRCLRNLN